MEKCPVVSVYLPTRNRQGVLVEAINSVRQQSLADFELIVVDDGSSDSTWAVLGRYASIDQRVKAIRFEKSRGAPAARNAALKVARGKLITGIDDDDLFLPNRLENLISAWTGRHSLVCSSFYRQRGSDLRKLNAFSREISLEKLLHYNVVGNQALMLREQVQSIGGFDETLVASQDYDLWIRMVQHFGPALRLNSCDYLVREGVTEDRISVSENAAIGASQFTRKHRHKMGKSHLKSQLLLQKITKNESLGLKDGFTCFSFGSCILFAKYFIKSVLRRLT